MSHEQIDIGAQTGRGRALAVLVVGAAMTQTAVVVAATASTLKFATTFGDRWGSVPATATVLGTAAGAVGLARLMRRTGRRFGMIVAYTVAAAGAGSALAGVPALVVAGLFLIGLGNAASQSARYAGAELYPASRRGFALGAVVWAGTIGAVGGPVLLGPIADLSGRFGVPVLTGAFLMVFAAAAIAAAVTTTPGLPWLAPAPTAPATGSARAERAPASRAAVRTATIAMMAAQGVMVAIMIAAPVHLNHHGYDLGAVGAMIGVHTLGMYALAPLSGYLTDRFGDRRVLLAALALSSGSAFMIVAAPHAAGVWLAVALFVLGYGWNLSMVAGSALLVNRVPHGDRIRVQGGVDARVWFVSAVASLASTQLFAIGGYATLAAVSVAPVLVAMAYVARGTSTKEETNDD